MRRLDRPERRSDPGAPRRLTARLAWFVGLWLASVAVLGAVAYAIRLWLGLG